MTHSKVIFLNFVITYREPFDCACISDLTFTGFLNLPLAGVFLRSIRTYATAVDKNALKELRNRTGIAFINCKKALEKFDNNIDQVGCH